MCRRAAGRKAGAMTLPQDHPRAGRGGGRARPRDLRPGRRHPQLPGRHAQLDRGRRGADRDARRRLRSKVGFTGDDVSGGLPSGCTTDEWGNQVQCAVPAGGVVDDRRRRRRLVLHRQRRAGRHHGHDDRRRRQRRAQGRQPRRPHRAARRRGQRHAVRRPRRRRRRRRGRQRRRAGPGRQRRRPRRRGQRHGVRRRLRRPRDRRDRRRRRRRHDRGVPQPSNDYNPPIALSSTASRTTAARARTTTSPASRTSCRTRTARSSAPTRREVRGLGEHRQRPVDDQRQRRRRPADRQDYDDTIDGGAGNDRVEGGIGHDTITGGPGKDALFGEGDGNYCGIYECKIPFGNDTIDARDGEADQVDCGVGTDTRDRRRARHRRQLREGRRRRRRRRRWRAAPPATTA